MGCTKVIYLTGAPASGKSTLIRGLARTISNVKVFEYGRAMSDKLSAKNRKEEPVTQDELRGGTDGHVTQTDIDQLDGEMTDWVARHRNEDHLIIDSHHVTIESYGFRIAPFSKPKLDALKIDEFWLLVLDNSATLQRIKNDPKGRRSPTPFQADFHTAVQAGLVAQYAVLTGRPVYVFDSSVEEQELLTHAERRLRL